MEIVKENNDDKANLRFLCNAFVYFCPLGKNTEDIEEFVESWKENPPQENIRSWGTSFSYEPPCLTRTDVFLQVGIQHTTQTKM